ncbi:MAG: hypothetical protein NW200_12555 [Hyphomonadaceae bacterium]|nr:hypothetical protein [Hyphomonadaceae bacterium]
MSGKNDTFSGWNGDEKGSPMVIMSPEAASGGGGGGGRITIVLLGITLLFALALAGYSMFRLDQTSREQKAAIAELTKKHTGEIKSLEEKLSRAKASVAEDREYATALETDNLLLKTKGRAASPFPPTPPERQKYIDELQLENAQRRTPGRVVRETPKRNVWPD